VGLTIAHYSTALAQFGGGGPGPLGARPAPAQEIKIKSPVAAQVFQRDANGRAAIPIALDESVKDATVVDAGLSYGTMGAPGDVGKFVDGKLVGVPVGGPYTVNVAIKKSKGTIVEVVSPVFVGDLWVLAGQSNMEGVGDLVDVTPPHPQVMCLGMDGKWAQAEEPLHWLVDSPDPVHSGDPKDRAERSARQHKTRPKGAGLGLPFAVAMVEQTRVPIGLVPCAHGGTSMEQWNPSKKGEGGHSLYGSMLRQIQLAGGKVKGVLWYQGESDANPEASKIYGRVFADFIASVRADLGQPELPFYFVQIGRFINGGNPKGWNTVQEAERRLPERLPNTAVVSVIDLELDDLIHVGTQGLKRAGHRLARIAQRELFSQVGATTPTLERVSRGSGNTLTLRFKGVNMRTGMGSPAMMGGPSMAGAVGMGGPVPPGMGMIQSPGEPGGVGLRPERHITGFSIRKEDGSPIPLVYEAAVGKARDTVVLKLAGPIPAKSFLWYGYGFDPDCNLTDGADMSVPVFGPIALDEVPEFKAPVVAAEHTIRAPVSGVIVRPALPAAALGAKPSARPEAARPEGIIRLLIITGDHGHDWKATTEALNEILSPGGKIAVDVTTTPAKDLTDSNLAKYDVLLLNYKDTPAGGPKTKWSDANKAAFLKAVQEGKGLVVFHFASSAFTKPNWPEFEKAIAGGWRSQGFHGPPHVYTVKKTEVKHPISDGLPTEFVHTIDELYQNSVMLPGNVVLATAYSDPKKPRGTGKDEPVIWVNTYGKGRVYNNALGHDVKAMADPNFHAWIRRGVIWAASGKVD
jgi:sialate O-acetylesterase